MDVYSGETPQFIADSEGFEPFHKFCVHAFECAAQGAPFVEDIVVDEEDMEDADPTDVILAYTNLEDRNLEFYDAMAAFLVSGFQRSPSEIQQLGAVIYRDQENPALRSNTDIAPRLIGALYAHDLSARGDENPYAQNLIWSLTCEFLQVHYLADFNPLDDPEIHRAFAETSSNLH